jgi:eukaryotic-like serine/threonine-protein kinase
MTQRPPCPDVEDLQRLVQGRAGDPQAEVLESHLLECPHCVQAMHTLKDEGGLAEALRQGATAAEVPQGAEVEGLVRRIRGLASAGTLTGAGSGTPPPLHEANTIDPTDPGGVATPPAGPGVGGLMGPYRLVRVLGRGGMGVVYAAEDPELRRTVALKVMKDELAANPACRERFLREARAVAALEDDHVVTVYHVGEDRGVPFLVMPLLQGETLQERLARQGRLPAAEVLRIGREMASGLAAAHARGLIHRDVKPANVWLERRTEPGSPAAAERVKLLDFGLARAVQEDTHLTSAGLLLGTPAYMSPEQTRHEAADARSDLYSLGGVLYAMCAGRPPFPHKEVMSLLVAVALDAPPPLRDLTPEVPPALADLVMRLLTKQPAEWPASAREVVEALQAIEQGGGVTPPPAPRGGRRRVPRAALAAAVLLGVLGPAGYFLGPAVYQVVTGRGGPAVPAKDHAGGDGTVPAAGPVGELRGPEGQTKPVSGVGFTPDGRQAVSGGWDGKVRLWDVSAGKPIRLLGEHEGVRVLGLAVAPQGPWAVSVGFDGTARVWDLKDQKPPPPIRHDTGRVTAVAVAADGTVATAGTDGTVQLWSAAGGKSLGLPLAGDLGELRCVALSPNGRHVLCGGIGGDLLLWDTGAADRRPRRLQGHRDPVNAVAFAPDGGRAASGGDDGTARVWDTASGKELGCLNPQKAVLAVAFTPDGKRLLTGGKDGRLRLWDAAAGRELRSFDAHPGRVLCVAVSADGQHALTGGDDGSIKVWGLPPAE